jgi:hypothetical protein
VERDVPIALDHATDAAHFAAPFFDFVAPRR